MGEISRLNDKVFQYTSTEGIIIKQREGCEYKIFTFKEKASEILKFTNVTRQADKSINGYQRVINPNRVKAIIRFLEAHPNNAIPNNIVIAITKGKMSSSISNNTLVFKYNMEDTEEQALIIDGQHRLEAINKFNPDEEVLVTALVDIDILEQAIQFITINTKSQSAAKTDVKSAYIGATGQ